ncbi:MAG: aminotransferase class IV [Chloroflexota bacterium]|nr:aminotransferase class IV [Chloroflexota bacterium]
MPNLQLFAVTPAGPQPLPIAADATALDDLYRGLAPGVYSSLRTFEHNKFLYLEHHLARTVTSMQQLGWPYRLNEERLRQAIHKVCTAAPWPDMRVRIDVLAESAHALGTNSRELIGLMPFTPLPATLYTQGVTVDFAAGILRSQPLVKTAAFVEQRKGFAVGTPDAYERLLTDADGFILEGLSSNFYAIQQGVVRTAGVNVLEGITRKIVLALITQMNLPLRLEALHKNELAALDEAAISSSSRGIVPVVAIGGVGIGNGHPGPLFARLRTAYDAFVAHTIQLAIAEA